MANKKSSKISKAARSLARLRWPKDPVMRLAARYGTRETLQVDADGKTVAMRTIGFDEHSLRQFFEAVKKAEA